MNTFSDNRKRRLSELLAGMIPIAPANERQVTGISGDSRHIRPGWLFAALPGRVTDGREFITQAIDRGAAAVIYEPTDWSPPRGVAVPVLPVSDLGARLGIIADRFYDSPSARMRVIGVTGTNGKTTCTHLLAQALEANGNHCAVIGTLGNGFVGRLEQASHTTPDVIEVHRLLAAFADLGATHVSMEVSSHGLEQGRVTGVTFDTAVFTNLTQDHLDYHGHMDAYGAAKARLFEAPGLRHAVINVDDAYGRRLLAMLDSRVHGCSYGILDGMVRADTVTPGTDGLVMAVSTPWGQASLSVPLVGRFNAANVLAVLSTLLVGGMALDEAADRLARIKPVAGRMECFGGGAGPLVVVDYAHTPDALEKVLMALREHTRRRLFCVFGCGGDRDRGKRPLMGAIAERLADMVVVTDDNPRHEPPEQIVAEVCAGMQTTPTVIHDRVEAIRWALEKAEPGDVILVAGKGHEETQQVGDARLPLSDRHTVTQLLGQAA